MSVEVNVPAGHKRTEVGVIPEDWNVKRTCEIASVSGGKRLPKGRQLLDVPTPHPYLRVADMRMGIIDEAEIKFVPEDAAPKIERYRIKSGDIYISVAGSLGVVGRVPAHLNGANLTENADKISSIQVDPSFLMFWLMGERIQQEIAQQSTIGAQPKLALRRIENFLVPVPPSRDEQRAIAEALSDAGALIEGLEWLIAKKRNIKQAAMQQLLTGKTRLPGFSGEWSPLNMSAHSTLKARIGWQGLTTAEYLQSGEYYLVTGTDFRNGRVDWSGCHFVERERYAQDRNIQLSEGDVLITKDGTIGKVGFVDDLPGPATLNSGVFVMRPRDSAYDPQFLFYILTSSIFSEFLDKLQAGSTIVHLYQKDFVDFEFEAPELDEQNAIATILSEMDGEIAALESKRDKARQIKQGMMQELLTGRTRLV